MNLYNQAYLKEKAWRRYDIDITRNIQNSTLPGQKETYELQISVQITRRKIMLQLQKNKSLAQRMNVIGKALCVNFFQQLDSLFPVLPLLRLDLSG